MGLSVWLPAVREALVTTRWREEGLHQGQPPPLVAFLRAFDDAARPQRSAQTTGLLEAAVRVRDAQRLCGTLEKVRDVAFSSASIASRDEPVRAPGLSTSAAAASSRAGDAGAGARSAGSGGFALRDVDPASEYPRGSRGGAATRPRTLRVAAAASPQAGSFTCGSKSLGREPLPDVGLGVQRQSDACERRVPAPDGLQTPPHHDSY